MLSMTNIATARMARFPINPGKKPSQNRLSNEPPTMTKVPVRKIKLIEIANTFFINHHDTTLQKAPEIAAELFRSELFGMPAEDFSREDRTITPDGDFV